MLYVRDTQAEKSGAFLMDKNAERAIAVLKAFEHYSDTYPATMPPSLEVLIKQALDEAVIQSGSLMDQEKWRQGGFKDGKREGIRLGLEMAAERAEKMADEGNAYACWVAMDLRAQAREIA